MDKLADDVMGGQSSLLREDIRNGLDRHAVDLANAVIPFEDDNPFVCATMRALEPSRKGLVDRAEAQQALKSIASEYGGPVDAIGGILDDVFDKDDAFASNRVQRSLIRRALKSKIPKINELTSGMALPAYEDSLTERVLLDLEKSTHGEVTAARLSKSLAAATGKPIDYWKLKELTNTLMDGSNQLTRRQLREALNLQAQKLRTLADEPLKQHPVIHQALRDLESSHSGVLGVARFSKTMDRLGEQHGVAKEKLKPLVDSIYALADEGDGDKVARYDLRQAMEARMTEIDAVFYPQGNVKLKHLTATDKVI